MKKTLFSTLLLLLLLPLASRAQHFEWAKGYGGTIVNDAGCLIKGSVTDDEGNLYILGQFDVNDTWNNGPRLLPMAPYGPGHTTVSALIAKISPSGEMLWKKVIHSNNGCHTQVHDIKKVGDTAFACLVNFSMPVQSIEYIYYLDTLITTWENYPIPNPSGPNFTAWLLFGFDGEVKEQHFIVTSLVDSAGNDDVIVYPQPEIPDQIRFWQLVNPTFDVDSEGNIYLARQASDNNRNLHSYLGNIMAVKFWVDNRYVGMAYTHGKQQPWFPQILKFSPHFDTLLSSRYVVQKSNTLFYPYYYWNLKVDNDDNVYYSWTMDRYYPDFQDTLSIDTLQDMSFFFRDYHITTAYLVRFDSDLSPQWLIELGDSIIDSSMHFSRTFFMDFAFDNDSNLFFLSACSGRGYAYDTIHYFSVPTYQGTPLNVHNDAFFMSFHNGPTQPELHSYGVIPAFIESDNLYKVIGTKGNLACKANRVFMQSRNIGGVEYPDTIIRFPQEHDAGLGFTVFDYAGKAITGDVYATGALSNSPGPISLQDSVLYLMQTLVSDATFGDIHLSVNERMASIAKYVDTSFMSPYVYTGDTGDVRIALNPDVGAFTTYPNPFRQRVWIRVENATLLSDGGSPTALLTDLQGHSETVRLEPQGDGLYLLDLSSRPQASYILTLTTTDGHQHSLTLLSQHDYFGQ